MVKRLFLLSLLVLALCGASTMSFAGGPGGGGSVCMPPPPGLPPVCGPAATNYSQVTEVITPVPAQLRKVRVVAPYLAGIAWPRTPLAFFGNPQTFPNPIAPGRYEWLVPVTDIKVEHFTNEYAWPKGTDRCCLEQKVPRCVYVKANYIKMKPVCGVPMAPPPPMPCKVKK
jgi:hypothetical protein